MVILADVVVILGVIVDVDVEIVFNEVVMVVVVVDLVVVDVKTDVGKYVDKEDKIPKSQ